MIDIGGGSTECMVGTEQPDDVRSFDVGCVRLTEKHLASDPPAPEELSNAIAEATGLVRGPRRGRCRRRTQAKTVIGLAGTISTIGAVELGMAEYDRDLIHHFRLTRDGHRGRVPHARHRARWPTGSTTRGWRRRGPT